MQREWSSEDQEAWLNRRADRRRQQKRDDPHNPRESSLERERDKVREGLQELTTKTFAWELQKYPLAQCPAPFTGKLLLPLRHMDDDYAHTLRFEKGEDMNLLVFRFYSSRPDPNFVGPNFVSPDGIASRRHEYLGPAPFVTGYRFDAEARTARIEWWDSYIQQMWIGRHTWKIEVYFDELVRGWSLVPAETSTTLRTCDCIWDSDIQRLGVKGQGHTRTYTTF